MKPNFFQMNLRRLMALAVPIALTLAVSEVLAGAPLDALDQPAYMSTKAPKALMLSVLTSGSRLIAAGEHGVIVYSDDQGQHWTQAQSPVSVMLVALTRAAPGHVWAVGHDGAVLASDDNGLHWERRFDGNQANSLMQQQASQQLELARQGHAPDVVTDAENALADVEAALKFGPSRPLLSVWFKNENEGWVVGSYGQIFHTTDAGHKWESISNRLQNKDGLHYNQIVGNGEGELLIAGEAGKIYQSKDWGKSWQTKDTGYQGQLYGVLTIPDASGETLLAYGFAGHAFRSGERNTTWHELTSTTRKNLIGGYTLPGGGVRLIAQDGAVLDSDPAMNQLQLVRAGEGPAVAGVALLQDLGKDKDKNQIQNQGQAGVLALAGIGGVRQIALDSVAGSHP